MLRARATRYVPGHETLLAVVLENWNYPHLWPIFVAVAADATAHLIPLVHRDDFGVALASLLHR